MPRGATVSHPGHDNGRGKERAPTIGMPDRPASRGYTGKAGAATERCGAPGGSRTPDQLLRRQLLYPLSYEGVGAHYSLQGIGRVGPASTRVCVQGRRIRAHLGTLARDSPRPPLARASPTSRMRPLFGRTRPGFRRRNPFRLPPGPDRRLVSIATRRPKDSVVRGRCADSRRSLSPGGTFVPCQTCARGICARVCVNA